LKTEELCCPEHRIWERARPHPNGRTFRIFITVSDLIAAAPIGGSQLCHLLPLLNRDLLCPDPALHKLHAHRGARSADPPLGLAGDLLKKSHHLSMWFRKRGPPSMAGTHEWRCGTRTRHPRPKHVIGRRVVSGLEQQEPGGEFPPGSCLRSHPQLLTGRIPATESRSRSDFSVPTLLLADPSPVVHRERAEPERIARATAESKGIGVSIEEIAVAGGPVVTVVDVVVVTP